jgi:hypothetical protein
MIGDQYRYSFFLGSGVPDSVVNNEKTLEPGFRIRDTGKNVKILLFLALGNMIRDVYPGSGFFSITD